MVLEWFIFETRIAALSHHPGREKQVRLDMQGIWDGKVGLYLRGAHSPLDRG